MSEKQIIFIVGCPRSGTTLLRDILISDNRIAIPDEELQIVPAIIECLKSDSNPELLSLLKRSPFGYFNPEFDFKKIKIAGQNLEEKWINLFSQLTNNTKAQVYGDKTPENYRHFKLLLECFSSAKFLFIIRDPRDVVMSLRKAWGKSYLFAVKKWQTAYRELNLNSQRADIYLISYEELLENPEESINQIGDWLECETLGEGALSNFVQSKEIYGDSKGIKGVVSSNTKKYYQSCPRFVHYSIEHILEKQMADSGYPRDFSQRNNLLLFQFYLYSLYDVPASLIRTVLSQIKSKGAINGIKYKLQQVLNKYGY